MLNTCPESAAKFRKNLAYSLENADHIMARQEQKVVCIKLLAPGPDWPPSLLHRFSRFGSNERKNAKWFYDCWSSSGSSAVLNTFSFCRLAHSNFLLKDAIKTQKRRWRDLIKLFLKKSDGKWCIARVKKIRVNDKIQENRNLRDRHSGFGWTLIWVPWWEISW